MHISRMQTKIVAIVVAALVVGFGLLVYNSMEKETKDLIEDNLSKTDLLSSSIITSMESIMMTGSPESIRGLVADQRKISGVKEIRVFGKDGTEAYIDAGYKPVDEYSAGAVKETLSSGTARKREAASVLTLYKPLLSEQRCKGCHTEGENVLGVVAVSVPLEGMYKEISKNRFWGIMNAFVAITLVAVVLGLWLKRVVLTPVEKAVAVMSGMEKNKDLTSRMEVRSYDEIGRLGKAFNAFIDSVQNMVHQINRGSYQVSSASTRIAVNSGRVLEGARIQARSVESTSGAIEQINASIKEIAGSANILYKSAEMTSSSIIEMTASIDEIAGSVSVLSSSVESTVSSISQIGASIKEVSGTVGILSDAVKTGVDTMDRISGLIEEVEVAAKDSSKLTETVTGDAKSLGSGAMSRAIHGMEKISASVERSGEVINRLGARSKQIGEILDIIDEVADQTELLSLNAAILASQAGEHGKGFAVVADEIKDLAERTASSTNEISKLIATVQAEAAEAVEAMESGKLAVREGKAVVHEAKEVLEGIVASSIKSSEMSKLIERSTAKQSEGASKVEESMLNIRDMVDLIQKATRELTDGSEQILREAYKVKDVSSQVKISTDEQSKGSEMIIRAIEDVNYQARQIASATAEHQAGSEDIGKSIERIMDVARENENLAEEMNLAVEDLAMHTEKLKERVSSFRVEALGTEMIKLGVVPLESPAQMYKKFYPLAEYLSKETGREVVFKLTSSFTDAVKDLGTGLADICYMTPSTYIEAHDKYGATLLAKAVRKGLPYSHTIIVTRADSPVDSLEGLKGKSFAFGDRMSTSSYLVPRYMLEKAGVRLSDLSEYRFLGHHDDVAKAVLLGEFDAGGLRETTAFQYKDKGLKFLKVSDNIPEFNFCSKPGLDEDLSKKIKDALVALDVKSAGSAAIICSIDNDYTGFMEARDSDYAAVREMVKKTTAGEKEAV